MSKVSTDVIRQVFDEGADGFIEIGPWSDDPGLVEIRTSGERSIQCYGSINLAMSRDFARAIANAILACADDAEKKQ